MKELKGIDVSGLPIRMRPRTQGTSLAKRLRSLPLNKGFTVSELAEQWGYTESTIERGAQDLKCWHYMELSDDNLVKIVMNPETAKEKLGR